MTEGLHTQARLLFRAALLVFIVTIVIGILNGLDIWKPAHNLLLTHVHAGTLGWITLAVVGVAFLMFGEGADQKAAAGASRLAMLMTVAALVYVGAFAAGSGIYRPIAGTLMLIAIVSALVWVAGCYRRTPSTTPRLALLLAMVSLMIGAILGVLLGLFIANGSVPGLSQESAAALAGAHPPAMLIGYLILAGVAVADWVLGGAEKRSGPIVAWSLFVAGILVNIAIIFDIEPLIQVATLLEVVAIILFLVRMWPQVKPSSWGGGGSDNFGRMSVIFLAVGIGLLVYLVQLLVSGQLDPETDTGNIGVLLAFDHSMFVGVMTNALFAAVGKLGGRSGSPRLVVWGVNLGLIAFLVGLVGEITVLKQIGSPIMGVALLAGIYLLIVQLKPPSQAAPV
ncbi:MAG: hypothetical protein Q8Q52_00875 [Acidimicrobiia bacterium]|nr:hypothetical protein [Acidimicrobiia bacterium]